MEPILGFDYGNYYSQLVYIMNMDPETRRGGKPLDLCAPNALDPNGIPTAFFRSAHRNNGTPICGHQATQSRPMANINRYLKRRLHEKVTLDGVTYTVAEMITATIQHCVREANRNLRAETQLTSNRIGLAYPATFSAEDRAFLKSLAQAATLEDGRHVVVVGTITEPAAAALDYLAEYPSAKPETCVMAYDLGGGTFDLSVVQAFPNGKRRADGSIYYYDVLWTDGISDLGGKEFDKAMYDLIVKKMRIRPTGNQVERLMQIAETTKRALTSCDHAYACFETPDGDVLEAEISLTEFDHDKAVTDLVARTVKKVDAALNDPNIPRPDTILLTGGASQMRIIKRTLEQAFPTYKGKIVSHRPSKAIAQGAARFNTDEKNDDISHQVVQQRTTLDLGTLYTRNRDGTRKSYIQTLIPRGTPIPFTSKEFTFTTIYPDQHMMDMSVYEAVDATPDVSQPDRDYRNVMPYSYDLKRTPQDEGQEKLRAVCQLVIDKDNILHMVVWEPDRKKQTMTSKKCTYEQWRKA